MRGIRIRPEKDGLKATLYDLEADVMDVVWSRGWPAFAVSDVHEALSARREIAYTTVMTTVARLHEKGLLDRERDGRRYLYRPRMDQAAFQAELARDTLSALEGGQGEAAMALLIEQVSGAEADTLDRLEALIRARRAELDRR